MLLSVPVKMAAPKKRNREVPDEHRSFGPWLKRRRDELDLTQEALAVKARIAQSQISDLENVILTPSPEMVKRLAPHLEISEESILLAAGYKPTGESVGCALKTKASRRRELIAFLVDDLPEAGQESALRIVQEIHAVYRSTGAIDHDSDPRK